MFKRKRTKMKEWQFTEHITGIRNKLYQLAYCYVKNEQEALAIVSEATYKGYIAFMKADTVNGFDPWMSRIAINTAIDYMYRHNPMLFLDDFTQGIDAPLVDMSVNMLMEEKTDLYHALDWLRPQAKTYIILKYFVGLSFPEMAELLSMPENIVESEYDRIMNQLRAYLIEGEVESV